MNRRCALPILLLAVLALSACQHPDLPSDVRDVLRAAGPNQEALTEVIDHYRERGDEEILQAAYYLISHLDKQYFIEESEAYEPVFRQTMAYLDEAGNRREPGTIHTALLAFNELADSIRSVSPPSFHPASDLASLTAGYLIENIDLAFEAWNRIPEHLRADQDLFLQYVLPYRSGREPAEPGLRKRFYEEFNWVYDRIEAEQSLNGAVCALVDSLDMHLWTPDYPSLAMPLSSVHSLGFQECADVTNLMVFILRSLGIATAHEYLPRYGNTPGRAHDWLAYYDRDGFYAVSTDANYLNEMYGAENFPKIYRRKYDAGFGERMFSGLEDVTDHYRVTSDLILDPGPEVDRAYLSVFSRNSGWDPVAESVQAGDGLLFEKVGRDVVYGLRDPDNPARLIMPPFYLDPDGEVHHLQPDMDERIDGVLTRKYYPFTVRYLEKLRWVRSLNGARIQGANLQDFSDAVTLLTIGDYSGSDLQSLQVDHAGSYRHYRLIGGEELLHIARFHPADENGEPIEADWEVYHEEEQNIHHWGHTVLDGNPLTYIFGTHVNVTFTFDEPRTIQRFLIQARNDDNDVKEGDLYELFYWDDGWQSAGRKEGRGSELIYNDLPSNALWWLRNLTGGREEAIFLLDEEGRQFWPGTSTVDPRLLEGDLTNPFNQDLLCREE